MRRCVLALFVACILALVALPTAAWAGTWVVKNQSGTKLGTVVTTSAKEATAYNPAGVRWGRVFWNSPLSGYSAMMVLDDDTGVRREALVRKRWFGAGGTGVMAWYLNVEGGSSWVPRKKNGRWQVYGWEGVANRSWGSVSANCPGWAAAGGLFVLNTRMR